MSWNGVKKQSLKADVEAWCEEMGIEDYTINSQGEIDVDGGVFLNGKDYQGKVLFRNTIELTELCISILGDEEFYYFFKLFI